MEKLTIFTPTFNRGSILSNLYQCLLRQTVKNFIWLIVDDGSSDNTELLVKSFIEEKKISIKYIYQTNSGKHVAHNNALMNCSTELFFCVDSDDILTDDAVEAILTAHKNSLRENILGYYFRKGTLNGKLHGDNFPDYKTKINLMDLYDIHKFTGEMAIVLKTNLIKGYEFPVYDKEKFVTETVLYNQINSIAPMKLINKMIYLFEYREDGYTANALKNSLKNPIGTAMSFLSDAFYRKGFLKRIKKSAQFLAWIKVMNIDNKIYRGIKIPVAIKLLSFVLYFRYLKLFKRYIDDFQ